MRSLLVIKSLPFVVISLVAGCLAIAAPAADAANRFRREIGFTAALLSENLAFRSRLWRERFTHRFPLIPIFGSKVPAYVPLCGNPTSNMLALQA